MKDELQFEMVAEILGRGEAEIIESMLAAKGIRVQLIQDSLSHSAYVTPFGLVQVFVAKSDAERARALIKEYQDGEELGEDQ
jgi:hypothetical protein